MQGLRETAATSVWQAHLPGATAISQDPVEALQQAVSTRLRPGFHRRYVPPPTPSSPIPPRVWLEVSPSTMLSLKYVSLKCVMPLHMTKRMLIKHQACKIAYVFGLKSYILNKWVIF
jgi:hypothetical protein